MPLAEARRLLDSCDLHAMLGLSVTGWRHGEVELALAPPDAFRDPGSGAVHGGALLTALDVAAGFALASAVGSDFSTIDLRADFLRPAVDAAFTVQGRVLRAGRRFGWGEATVLDAEGRALATGRGTFVYA